MENKDEIFNEYYSKKLLKYENLLLQLPKNNIVSRHHHARLIKIIKEEIDEAYEKNTGLLIVDYFKEHDCVAMPAVLCKNHGPFTWGKDAKEAVHNAVVLEEVAKMAARCEMIQPKVQPAPQELQDKHYYRKHGANAYYGQSIK